MHHQEMRMGIQNTTRILDISYLLSQLGSENSMQMIKESEELTKYEGLPSNT